MVPTPLPPLGESRFLAPGSRAPLLSKTQKPASAGMGSWCWDVDCGFIHNRPQAGGAQLALHRRPETNGGEFTQATHAVLVTNTLLIRAAL